MSTIYRVLRALCLPAIFLCGQGAQASEFRCATVSSALPAASAWLRSEKQPARGVALVVHGLNLRPDKMDSIARTLNEEGFDVLRASLSGHRGDLEQFKHVSRDRWLHDLHDAYCEARRAADRRGLPLNFVGYSLGALVNLDLMNNVPEAGVRYDRMVLLAPAAALNWTSQLVRALNAFGEDFLVPSASNATYRASCEGTSMAAYNALFDSLRATQESGLGKSKAPTLVLIDPKDELVSGPGLAELIEFNALNEWRLEQVSNRGATLERGAYHHLIIDEPSVGSEEWKRIQTLIRKHLEPMGTSGSLKP